MRVRRPRAGPRGRTLRPRRPRRTTAGGATAPRGGRTSSGSLAARTMMRESAKTRTTASQRHAERRLVGGRGSPQMVAEGAGQGAGQAGRRDEHEDGADDAERRASALDGALENLRGTAPACRSRRRIASLFEPRVAIRMSTGSTEVKNWAAIVIDRSNTSIRPSPAAAWSRIRPGHRSSSQPTRCCSPAGRRPSAASARARAGSLVPAPVAGCVRLSGRGAASFGSIAMLIPGFPRAGARPGPAAPARVEARSPASPRSAAGPTVRAGRPRPGGPW